MIINYSSNGTYSEDGNGGYIWRRNTQDGHGGRAEEHRAEMRQIAEEIAEQKIAAIIPQIQAAALQQARDDLLRAFAVDVETVVEVAFANGEKIFRDKKTQKVIADSIMREIRKRLDHLAI